MKVGEIVHYVLHDGPRRTECRPAIIVRVTDPATRTAVITLFTDGLEDGDRFHSPHSRLTVREGEPGQPGRFHACQACLI